MSDESMHMEPPWIWTRTVLAITLGFFVFSVLCLIFVFIFYENSLPSRPLVVPRHFPSPELPLTPLANFENLKKSQMARLQGYSWADKSEGLVHVPIERAMQILVSRGTQGLEPLAIPPVSKTKSADEVASQAMEKALGAGEEEQEGQR